MRSHTKSVVIEPNRRRITGCISYKPLISDISVLRVCNKTGGTIKGDIYKMFSDLINFACILLFIVVSCNDIRAYCMVRHRMSGTLHWKEEEKYGVVSSTVSHTLSVSCTF